MPFQKIAPAKKLGGDAFILHGLNKKKGGSLREAGGQD
jgi:hypothetical protein